ncbi:hypothetical protein NDU88_004701 [Pleurodeles waltl]|uniref:Uncharacterized protein n=1 Tax=Pleurodeles waltl TaxID=8319 RepID=A0AAV7L1P9_PLEWA|nr:hypothetical protein NDU88_004701 [Pleurodeles waltl]
MGSVAAGKTRPAPPLQGDLHGPVHDSCVLNMFRDRTPANTSTPLALVQPVHDTGTFYLPPAEYDLE